MVNLHCKNSEARMSLEGHEQTNLALQFRVRFASVSRLQSERDEKKRCYRNQSFGCADALNWVTDASAQARRFNPSHATLRIMFRQSLEASVRILRTCVPHRSSASLRSERKSWRWYTAATPQIVPAWWLRILSAT